jgi:tRNA 2-thiouridine synthesizing protein A
MSHHELDARNLLCPMPVIRTQDKVKTLHTGDTLDIICTDPGANSDIPAWCKVNGHTFLESREQDNTIILRIKVGESG